LITELAHLYRRTLAAWVDLMRRRAALVVVLAALSAVAGLWYAAANLTIDTDTTDMLAKDLPFRKAYDEYKAAFPQFSDNIVIVIDGNNPDVVADAGAQMAARLRAEPELFPYVFDPRNDPFFIRNGLLYLDEDELAQISDRLARAQPLIGTLAKNMNLRGFFDVLGLAADEIAEGNADPATLTLVMGKLQEAVIARIKGVPYLLSWQELMSGKPRPEDRRHVIVVQPKLDYSSLQPAAAAMAAIRLAAGQIQVVPGGEINVRLTGAAALQDEEFKSVTAGAGTAGVLSLVLVTVLLIWGLHSARLITASLLTLVMGLAWTAAFATIAIGHLNLISVTFAVLFIGVAVDFGIQFCFRYGEWNARGLQTAEALRKSAVGVGGALTLVAGAAGIGFFSFVPTDYVGLSELGIISGVSMGIAWFANLTVLPALLALMPLKPGTQAEGPGVGRSGEPALGFVLRHPFTITIGAVLLGLAGLAVAPQARFDFNPLNLQDPTTESVQTLRDLMRSDPSAAYTIAVLTPDLAAAEAMAGRLDRLPVVDETLTLNSFLPRNQEAKLNIIDGISLFLRPVLKPGAALQPQETGSRVEVAKAFRAKLVKLADSPDAGLLSRPARRLANGLDVLIETRGESGLVDLENSLLATLPAQLERLRLSLEPEVVTLDDLPPDLRARALAPDGRALVTVVPAGDMNNDQALRRFVREVRAVAPNATDNPVVMVEAGNAVVQAFQEAGAYSVVGIVVLLLVVMRNITDTLFVLSPLLLAAVLTVAFTVVGGTPFNFANIIALPLLLSLGVGYGIYLVLRHRATATVADVLTTNTPRAVLFSALTTMCSFGTLAVSHHRGTASMGILLFVALTLALFCTLIVLTAMQEIRDQRNARLAGRPAP